MQEIRGNLWNPWSYSIKDLKPDAICITTNGFVKSNDEAVMGRGCAKEAKNRIPKIAKLLGQAIKVNGNHVHFLIGEDFPTGRVKIFSFPVKGVSEVNNGHNVVAHMKSQFKLGDTIPGWALKADIELIEKSAKELVEIIDNLDYSTVILPKMGCGAGELEWSNVKNIVSPILDNRFYIITF